MARVCTARSRPPHVEFLLLPMAGVLVWLVLFLMAAARTSYRARINLDTQTPASHGCDCARPEPVLHVYAMPRGFLLSWRTRDHLDETSWRRDWTPDDEVKEEIWVTRRPHEDGPLRYPELAAQVQDQWRKHGRYLDPSSLKLDQAMLHSPPGMPYREMVAILDAIHQTRRPFPGSQGKTYPAFNVEPWIDAPGQAPPDAQVRP